jgi:hypothetical protein
MANVVIVREVGNNQAPQFERIDFSLPPVDSSPPGRISMVYGTALNRFIIEL